ncbi:alpha/beta-hydrolase [Coniochaeta ligniaria NRRL 30616]|uniref:Alpha/beta-hydrolase n=1 Tax=Coniochaeta ligniaria NRRL 30616 TaxID=1408157 RepID=A0A1J7J740_9PEZI|nr:alpha/beta-hydrolase [Coniochaeta ligniaria NRRL 30616]
MTDTDPRKESHGQPALKQEPPPLLSKLSYAAHIYSLQGFISPYLWMRDWKEYFYPPDGGPNIIKRYEVRPYLPIRIFFPKSYDQTSPQVLPTLFTIHGGGFCIGHSRDDDEWNRRFANKQKTLVIALNYSKAPQHPFPTALHDLEALLLAALADESLPIDRSARPGGTSPSLSRTAVLGFSAGGNLALAVSQLPSVRAHPQTPAAAISVYGCLDLSVPPAAKLANRPVKPTLAPPRGGKDALADPLAGLAPTFDWSYIPYGHDLRDPLLSPAWAEGADLPPFVGVVAAELDMLAHESWRLACRLSRRGGRGRAVPDRLSKDEKERVCGRREVGRRKGALEDINNERFGFEDYWDKSRGGVKWLLVPDVLHGFDNPHIRGLMGGEVMIKDAEMKTRAYVEEMGNWLRERVWGL